MRIPHQKPSVLLIDVSVAVILNTIRISLPLSLWVYAQHLSHIVRGCCWALVIWLHDGKLIKDRLYHLRTYPNYFLAQELTDWLNSHKEALDRATVVCLLQHLMDMTLCTMVL
uniref:DEP domain-containing protein n=1 Tax=Oncorhynchus mykiss TaxID=8022 RepID=A0A8K9WPE2_ONCMY